MTLKILFEVFSSYSNDDSLHCTSLYSLQSTSTYIHLVGWAGGGEGLQTG